MSKKKICAIAAAAVLAIGIGAYAASGIITSGIVASWGSSSSSVPEYDNLPEPQQIMKDIGYEAKIVEKFSNGYTFSNASIVNNSLKDESGNKVEEFKSVAAHYEKDNDTVMLSVDKFDSENEMCGEVIATVDGIELYYNSYTNKLVPPNYELTDEDKRAEESGELIFSYGSDSVYLAEVQGLAWVQDGIQYNFTQIDGALSAVELAEMAVEIINK